MRWFQQNLLKLVLLKLKRFLGWRATVFNFDKWIMNK
jgi:hypothetical protein